MSTRPHCAETMSVTVTLRARTRAAPPGNVPTQPSCDGGKRLVYLSVLDGRSPKSRSQAKNSTETTQSHQATVPNHFRSNRAVPLQILPVVPKLAQVAWWLYGSPSSSRSLHSGRLSGFITVFSLSVCPKVQTQSFLLFCGAIGRKLSLFCVVCGVLLP